MTVRKTERLLNLLIMLLVQRHYVSKERIRAILYPDSSDRRLREDVRARQGGAAQPRRARSRSGSMDAYFDDEPGYRIRPDEFALPDITPRRRRGRGRRPGHPGLGARPARRGDHRGGPQADRGRASTLDLSALDIAEPRLSADEPAFDVFWEATQERTPVEFDYRRPGDAAPPHPAPAAVGRRPLLRPLVRRRPRHRPRRGAGLPALPGRGRRAHGSARPASYDVPAGHRPPRDRPPAGARRRRRARRSCWSARAPARAAPRRRERRGRRRRPRRPTALGPARAARSGTGWPTSCSATAPTSYVEEPAELRDEVVARLARRPSGARRERRPPSRRAPAAPRTRSPGC